jgi:ferredoxin
LSTLSTNPPIRSPVPPEFDLLCLPVVGPFLHGRHARTVLQIPLLVLSVVMILQGLFGPTLAPKNLATVLTWVHFRGALVLVLLVAGNFFCLACPFMLVRNAARRLFKPWMNWPRALRNKWLAVGLFAAILFVYELFDLWNSPWWTAWLIVGYFLAALAIDGVFKHATFCKFVCPIGQFNFVASLISPLEIKIREPQVCDACKTLDCIRGRREMHSAPQAAPDFVVLQRGCELALFQPLKAGNMDCTFCLDCVHACPHDNVGITSRLPASELLSDPPRSGIGWFSRRKDIAALVMVFTFGALLNAFGMVSPVYAVEKWLGGLLHVEREAPVLAVIFGFFLVIEPLVLLGLAAWLTKVWSGSGLRILPLAVRYSYSLAPIGFGMWLAHYGFHFFSGLYTVIPVTQNLFASLGWPVLGAPAWRLTGIPSRFIQPMEIGFLLLGLAGSLLVAYRLAEEDAPAKPISAFVPWAAVSAILFLASLWLMYQPMEMRAMLMGG